MKIRTVAARAALCLPVAALVVGAAGCTSGSSSSHDSTTATRSAVHTPTDSDAVLAAYPKTAAAKTSKVSLVAIVGGEKITGSGVQDFTSKDADLTLSTPQGPVQTRVVGGVVYTKLPAVASTLLHGKQWVRLDPSGAGGDLAGTPQPTDVLGYLEGLSSSVKKVGTETVRGTQTTHYTATVELDKVAAKAGTAQASTAIAELEKRSGVTSFPIGLWIDGSGMLRRVQTTVPAATKGQGSQVTVELYDFGSPVHVVAPPSSEVTDPQGLSGSLGGT